MTRHLDGDQSDQRRLVESPTPLLLRTPIQSANKCRRLVATRFHRDGQNEIPALLAQKKRSKSSSVVSLRQSDVRRSNHISKAIFAQVSNFWVILKEQNST